MEIRLHTANIESTINNAFFLFMPEHRSGIIGPDIATASANRDTNNPASVSEM